MEQKTIILSALGFILVMAGVVWFVSPKDVSDIGIASSEHELNLDIPQEEQNTEPDLMDYIINDNTNMETTNAVIKTNKGEIEIELFTGQMPITAGNFVKLINEGFYNGIVIHRVEPNFVVQAGDPQTKELDLNDPRIGSGGPGYKIEDEFNESLSNISGTLSMANSGPNTGGSQFFINLGDNTFLDFDKEPLASKHPVFGKVISGMEVVRSIEKGDVIESAEVKN